jgi:hypothetical protein
MRRRGTSQVNGEMSNRVNLERWSTRNLSSEDARPELGMSAADERGVEA